MRIITYIYNKIVLSSPRVEVFIRQFYWKNYKRFKKYRPKKNIEVKNIQKINFEKIISYLKDAGVKNGSLLILHSSYASLEKTGLSPDEIIDKLKDLIGETGTLCMPVIRKFKEEPKLSDILSTNTDDLICTYDVKKTKVVSGVLPFFLKCRKNCIVSKFPLNPMAAIGSLSAPMMEHNLEGDFPSPHGQNSSWKFCFDNNAIVVGLGINLSHYLTIMHVAEEAFPGWPVKGWYRKRKFIIKDGDFETKKTVLERKPKWGMLHIAERNFENDIIKNKILINKDIEGVRIGVVKSYDLINFLNKKKKNAYPYVISSTNLKK